MLNCIFVGDVMPGSQKIRDFPDGNLTKCFNEMDMVVGNLECPIVSQSPSRMNFDKIPLWSPADNIGILKAFGFSHFSLNNNHTLDLYEEGMNDTIRILSKETMGAFGLNYVDISQLTVIEKKGIKLGIFSVNWIQSQFNEHLFKELKDIEFENLKRDLDFLICMIHWGDDHNVYINRKQQDTAKQLIDRGVDLIIGHHPHVPQGYEVYKEKYIFYSLGNFIFTPKESYKYLPYNVRYQDARENMLFQRLICKIGLYVNIVFTKDSYSVEEIKYIFRQDTLPVTLPGHLEPYCRDLEKRMNDQIGKSDYDKNESEKRRIIFSYILPFILKRPAFWPMLLKRFTMKKLAGNIFNRIAEGT